MKIKHKCFVLSCVCFLITVVNAEVLEGILPPDDATYIVPFEPNALNHSYPEIRDNIPVYTPIVYKSYFKAERAMYDYYPRFHPGYVSYDSNGRAYNRYGAVIQTLNGQGQWEYNDLKTVVDGYVANTIGWQGYKFWGTAGYIEEAYIRFDNDGDAYVNFVITRLDDNGNELPYYKSLLLHSTDNMDTWKVYVLPYRFVRFEKLDVHNQDCLNRPPVLLLSHSWSPTSNFITIPEKQQDGTLVIPTPVKIDDDCVMFAYHSGDASNAITHGDKVYIVYGKMIPLGDPLNGTPAYAVTYDVNTKQLTSPIFIGYGGDGPGGDGIDNHNWPAMTIDSQGYLHVIINGHHDSFQYTKSTQPYSTSAWDTSISVSAGTQYATLNCDGDDTLYAVTRCSNPGYCFRLVLHRKKTGQNWESDVILVEPYRLYYKIWLQKMSVDTNTGKLCLTYYAQGGHMEIFKDDYLAHLNIWADREKQFVIDTDGEIPENTALGGSNHVTYDPPYGELCNLISDDGGDTWHLALTSDFITP